MYPDSSIPPCGRAGPASTDLAAARRWSRAGQRQLRHQGQGLAASSGLPRGSPAAPRPSPPAPYSHRPSLGARRGAERRAGLAARPPGPGSAASSGAGRGGMRRAGPPGRGPAERVTNKANGDWSGGGPAPRAADREGRERGGKPSTAWPAMEARGCFCPRSSPESWAPARSARASQR